MQLKTPSTPPIDAKDAGQATVASKSSLTHHYLNYLLANVMGIIAGFISFPIMTRLLSKSEYGIFGYFETIALVWVAFLKLGTQHSIVRFYREYTKTNDKNQDQRFYSTMVVAPALIASGISLFALVTTLSIFIWKPASDLKYLLIVLIICLFDIMNSLNENILSAQERSKFLSRYGIVKRYIELIAISGVLYFISRSAMSVYEVKAIYSAAAFTFMVFWVWKDIRFNLKGFDSNLFRHSLSYGFPLIFNEISFILLAFADRLILKQKIGYADLGLYTIGYSMAIYLGTFMSQTLFQAFPPTAIRIYELNGAQALRRLKYKILRILTYAAALLSVGLLCVSNDFILFMSGPDKKGAAPVFLWVGIAYVIQPLITMASYGLIIYKKSKIITSISVVTAILNVVLNLWWIPYWGMMGSVYATVISYGLMGMLQYIFCPSDLRTMLRLKDLLKPLSLAILLYAVARWTHLFGVENHLGRLMLMSLLGIVLFVVPAVLIDSELRGSLNEKLSRFTECIRNT